MKKISDVRVVATSLLVSISDVTLNLTVAFFTGSTVMLAQALQGLSDLITGAILFVGVKRSHRMADADYHFGYGREVFFWVILAGVLMFLGTGGLSVYFGWQQVVSPNVIENVWLAFAMLIFGFSMNGYAFSLSFKRLKRLHHGVGWWHQLVRSSVVETKATFLIDLLGTSAALIGIVSMSAYLLTGDAVFDGYGSIAIGLFMMLGATMLIRDARDLLVGRAVSPETVARINQSASSVDGVDSILDLRTMYIGSNKILVILEVHMKQDLITEQIEQVIDRVKQTVQNEVPEVHHIQVEVETPDHELII